MIPPILAALPEPHPDVRVIGGDAHAAVSPGALIRHFNRAQRLAGAGSWEWDIATNEVLWSSQTYAIFGLDSRAFRPSYAAILERVHPDDRLLVERAVQDVFGGAKLPWLDHRIVRPDGAIRVVREQAEVEYDAEGRPRRVIGALLDVTEIRNAEATARQSQEILATMLRISPEAIIVTDEQARILGFSIGAEEMFGYGSAEVSGQSVEILLPDRFKRHHRQHVAAFAAGSVPGLRMHDRSTILGLRKSGEEFAAEASLAKLEGVNGVAFAAIVRDLSAQKAAELRLVEAREEAERASAAKSTFLANMSHEIRTPLNGVLGIAGALARTKLTPKQQKMLGLIESSGRALEGLLSDILDLAKIDAGRMSLRDEPFDLGAVASETIELFRARAAEKGVDLTLKLAPEAAGWFRGDDLKIRQVLSNLLSNAVKFTAEGEVRLTVTAAPGADGVHRARIVVRDTGIGFSEELAGSLFERFEQADGSITRRFGGTGLGLAISKSLVDLMDGTIAATAVPGRGATFEVEIPLRAHRPPREDPRTAGEAMVASLRRRLRVLLAEDHPVNRMTVELVLENLPVDITSVENGADALAAREDGEYDLILMDMQMPVMDGLAAVRRIRAHEAEAGRRRTPICVLSANAMAEHEESALAAGADDFMTKPISAQGLIEYVTRISNRTATPTRAA